MLSFSIPTSLLLISLRLAYAGQHPLGLNGLDNSCSPSDHSSSSIELPEVLGGQQNESCHDQKRESVQSPAPPSRPWTYEPVCVTDEESWEDYCIYTNANFANGRGISFFTTPAIARRIEKLPAFVEKSIHDKTNDFSNPPWEIRYVEGKGNGLFATRTLRRGDQILADTPVGVYQSDAFFPDYLEGYKTLRVAFDQLPLETKEIFMRMATHSHGDPVMERINTNAFAGEFEGAPHFLLYPETALMNHDCRPNAMYYHDPSTLIHATFASRTILPGEEITITYINILQSRQERQAALFGPWAFTCTCSLCSASHSHISASDNRIAQINELQTHLTDWSGGSIATPAMAEELLKLYADEKLYAAEGMGHLLAAHAYNAVGKAEEAARHGKLALERGLPTSGRKEEDEREMRELSEKPEEHWTWLKRT